MLRFLNRVTREPLWVIGSLFPFVLLVRHVPGLPIPVTGGLPWRQELFLSFLLSTTIVLLLRHALRANHGLFDFHRSALPVIVSGTLFTLWMLLSSLWAAYPPGALHYTLQWSAYLIFFILMKSVASRPRLLRASFIALGITIWILGISCAIEFWFGAPLTDGDMRFNATPILRANSGFGEVTAVATCLFAAFALHVRRPRYALACGVTAALAWMATFQALQRAPLVGAAAGLLLLAAGAVFKSNVRPRSLRRTCLLFIALLGVAALQTAPSTAMNENAPSSIERLQNNVQEDVGVNIRLMLWGIGLEMLRAHPLLGVGANNYEVAYPEARRQFSARHLDSPLINLEEQNLAGYAHNEYIQIVAELGIVGFTLFVIFCVLLVKTFWRALKHPRNALPSLGAGGAMIAFAISSGASPVSFRNLGGGLLFFFAASLLAHIADSTSRATTSAMTRHYNLSSRFSRGIAYSALGLTLVMLCSFGARATSSILEGKAQVSNDPVRAEQLYRKALFFNGTHPPLHFSYGMWLYSNGRAAESLPHLRYAVSRGFNSTPCYAYLAEAEKATGDLQAVERTTAQAANVYPKSVFARTRHAVALHDLGKFNAGEGEFNQALAIDERGARGWWQLIQNGRFAAARAAIDNSSIAPPAELSPSECVYAVLREDERSSSVTAMKR